MHGGTLTENHERGLLASAQYASKLIRDCEEILAASDRPSPLNRFGRVARCVSASLARKWFDGTLHEHWAPALDRAVAAYLDVLKQWAADGLAQLREEFESGSRPLLAQLDVTSAPPGRDGPVPVESDLRWLREAKHPNISRV